MLEKILAEGIMTLGLELDSGAIPRFREYFEALMSANREFNLTAIEGEEEAAKLHFLDCLALLNLPELHGDVADVGTGGGLPGMALKIGRPELNMTLIDATEKKVDFLRRTAESLHLDCRCIHGRAEELGREPDIRESFDCVVSRAVANLSMLSELCLPLARVGGSFVAMKALDSDGEIESAQSAVTALGGMVDRILEYTVPGTNIIRRAVVVRKIAATGEKYPRRFAKIQKSPL